jgi:ABC-type Fe3+-hydroxamate transport system substrate-binding protein
VLFLAEWAYKTLTTAREQIEAAGIPIVVIDYNAQLLERHLASTRAIGAVMGTAERAEELATLYERSYADTMKRVAAANTRIPKVYVELGWEGAETIGNTYNGTMWGQIITNLKAENIAVGRIHGPWGPLNAEAIIAANPDVIFIAGSSWVNRPKALRTGYDATPEAVRRSLESYLKRPGWESLSAVKQGELHAIEHGLARSLLDFTATQYIAKRLYPKEFSDVDPEQALRDYHVRYLPVSYSGVWMLPLRQ